MLAAILALALHPGPAVTFETPRLPLDLVVAKLSETIGLPMKAVGEDFPAVAIRVSDLPLERLLGAIYKASGFTATVENGTLTLRRDRAFFAEREAEAKASVRSLLARGVAQLRAQSRPRSITRFVFESLSEEDLLVDGHLCEMLGPDSPPMIKAFNRIDTSSIDRVVAHSYSGEFRTTGLLLMVDTQYLFRPEFTIYAVSRQGVTVPLSSDQLYRHPVRGEPLSAAATPEQQARSDRRGFIYRQPGSDIVACTSAVARPPRTPLPGSAEETFEDVPWMRWDEDAFELGGDLHVWRVSDFALDGIDRAQAARSDRLVNELRRQGQVDCTRHPGLVHREAAAVYERVAGETFGLYGGATARLGRASATLGFLLSSLPEGPRRRLLAGERLAISDLPENARETLSSLALNGALGPPLAGSYPRLLLHPNRWPEGSYLTCSLEPMIFVRDQQDFGRTRLDGDRLYSFTELGRTLAEVPEAEIAKIDRHGPTVEAIQLRLILPGVIESKIVGGSFEVPEQRTHRPERLADAELEAVLQARRAARSKVSLPTF